MSIILMTASNWRMLLRGWSKEVRFLNTWMEEKGKGKNLPKVSLPQKLLTLGPMSKKRRTTRGNTTISSPYLEKRAEQTSLRRKPWRGRPQKCCLSINRIEVWWLKSLTSQCLGSELREGWRNSKQNLLFGSYNYKWELDVCRIMIDYNISYNIMFSEPFENMGMERGSL